MHPITESEIRRAVRSGGFRWYAVDCHGLLATLCDFEGGGPEVSGHMTHDAWNLATGYFWRLVNPHAGLYWYERTGDIYKQVCIPEGVPQRVDRLPEPVRSAVANIVLDVSFSESKEFPARIVADSRKKQPVSTLSREENNRRWQAFCEVFQLGMVRSENGEYWLFENEKAHYPGGVVVGGFCPDCWDRHGDFSSLRYRREERDDFLVEIAACPVCGMELLLPGDDVPILPASSEPVDERAFRR